MSYLGQAVPAKIIRVSGTSLFVVAARELGDSTQWYRIAEMNFAALTNADGFVDPWITATVELAIPGPGVSNGGILGA